jgi:peptidoglycan/xylan/chitin deacetylase (PgdA/CDA1 family)
MEVMLWRYVDLADEFGCQPTFPVTAVTLRRHPHLIRELAQRGVELAVHGYVHIDYRSLSADEQSMHVKKAIGVFDDHEIPFTGFRAPYLRRNAATLEVLGNLGLLYDSSRVVSWKSVRREEFTTKAWRDYTDLLDYYSTEDADGCLVLPNSQNGVIVIPVSIPDDEALVGRLGVREWQEIAQIWKEIFRKTYANSELFTVQLHHERVPYCEDALRALLQEARSQAPLVWIATLGEIANWWKERESFTLEVSPDGENRWRVKATCPDRATVLIRNCVIDGPSAEWTDGYRSTAAREFVVESSTRPCVGLAPNSSEMAIRFFESEGYLVEVSDRAQEYSVYFDNLAHFAPADERTLSQKVEGADGCLVRIWRWPDGAKSALAITGDIDSMTLIDFAMRVFEVWRQRLAIRGTNAR